MLAVFDRLGITEEMKAKTKAMPVNTGYVAELVARGEAEMAAQQMPELKAVGRGRPGAAAAGAPACHRVFGRPIDRAGRAQCGQRADRLPVVARRGVCA